MKDVDQGTGEDLNPSKVRTVGGEVDNDAEARNPDRPSSMPLISLPDLDDTQERKKFQRVGSPERWEIKQMMAANVIDNRELPDFDEETGLLPKDDDSGSVLLSSSISGCWGGGRGPEINKVEKWGKIDANCAIFNCP